MNIIIKRIYLAGPDVFLPDPMKMAEQKKQLCVQYGFEGVFPLDATLDLSGMTKRVQGLCISDANEKLIRSCDAVLANITPFRGPSADPGTTYEMGFARGLGLPVFAYSNIEQPFVERTREWVRSEQIKLQQHTQSEVVVDSYGMTLEDFNLADNLMIEGAVHVSGGKIITEPVTPKDRFVSLIAFERCLQQIQDLITFKY